VIKGYTFQSQLFDSQSWAHIINVFLDKQNGITRGCEISNTADDITLQAGYFVTYGRLSGIVGQEIIDVEATVSGELFARLVYEVDLNQTNTTTEFNQGAFKVLTDTTDYPALTQEDLDAGGMVYQLIFAEFKITTLGIANFVDKRVFLTLESAQSVFQATFDAFIAGLEAETYVSQTELTSALEDKVSKPTTATNNNLSAFDTDQDAIKDSGISIESVVNIRVGVRIGTVDTAKYYTPGWSSPVGVSLTTAVATNTVTYIPIYIEKDTDIIAISSNHRNTTNSDLIVAFYSWVNGKPSVKIGSNITITGGTTTGVKETTITVNLKRGLYFIGCVAATNDFSAYSLTQRNHIFTANNTTGGILQDVMFFTQASSSLPTTANPTATSLSAPVITIRED